MKGASEGAHMARRKKGVLESIIAEANKNSDSSPGTLVWRTDKEVNREEAQKSALKAELDAYKHVIREISPLVKHGHKMTGRKEGAYGPLKDMLREEIAELPRSERRGLTPKLIWNHLKQNSPKGWDFGGDTGDTGAEVWSEIHKEKWKYKRFQNAVYELRDELGLKSKQRKKVSKKKP
jgi:hypothetical protein